MNTSKKDDLPSALQGIALFAFGAYQASDNKAFLTIHENINVLRSMIIRSSKSTPEDDIDEKQEGSNILSTPVSAIGLSPSVYTTLMNAGIMKVGELVERTRSDIIGIEHITTIAIAEIIYHLDKLGLKLKEETNEVNNERTQENPQG